MNRQRPKYKEGKSRIVGSKTQLRETFPILSSIPSGPPSGTAHGEIFKGLYVIW